MLLAVCAIFAVLGTACGDAVVGNVVAFTAALDNEEKEFTKGDVIVYNKIILNHGNGFNSATGVFTAPKGGIYVFHIHALTSKGYTFQLELYRNEEYIISAYANQFLNYDSAGNTAVLKLKKGDRVYVKPAKDTYLFGTPAEVYATFSGYLIGSLKE